MKEEEFFNKLIDATSNILTKVVEELNRFRTDNNELVEIKKKEKRNEVLKKCELEMIKSSDMIVKDLRNYSSKSNITSVTSS